MTPHEEQYPRTPDPDGNWTYLVLVGIMAVVVFGTLFLIADNRDNPDRNAMSTPASTQRYR